MNDVRLDQPRGHPISAGVIRLGVAKEIVSVLKDLGSDPDAIISEAGLDPRLFEDGNNTIPFAALGRLVGLCVARTSCPVFGLLSQLACASIKNAPTDPDDLFAPDAICRVLLRSRRS